MQGAGLWVQFSWLRVRVEFSGLRAQGSGFQGSGLWVQGFRAQGSEFRVSGLRALGLRIRVLGSRTGVESLGFRFNESRGGFKIEGSIHNAKKIGSTWDSTCGCVRSTWFWGLKCRV